MGVPGRDRTTGQIVLVRSYDIDTDGLLQLHHQAGPDGFDDCRCPALLSVHSVVQVRVIFRIDVADRSTADDIRYRVRHQLAAHHQHSRRAGPTDKFVR